MTATAPYADKVGGYNGLGGTLKVAPMVLNFDTTALVDESEVEVGRIPAHTLVVGGWLVADDLDTNATETLELDFGWAANGADQTDGFTDPYGVVYENAGYQASQTGLIDSGVISGDAITDLVAAGKSYRPVLLSKPLYFKRETDVVVHFEAIAATQAAGSATLYLSYLVP